jgi:hypothetical protein
MRFLVLALALTACSTPAKQPAPEPLPPPPPAAVRDAAPAEPDAAPVPIDAAPALRADGESCFAATDCASGVCEGQGCGDQQPGTCAPAQRACTRDLRPYCGCDGKTFRTSGSCPGRRYHAKGECPTAAKNRPVGALCLTASQCASGVCEGQGCSDDQPGLCADKVRPCTDDLAQFCSCNGKTVAGSSSCPGVRFSARGGCTGS